jgi:hypothetical protein
MRGALGTEVVSVLAQRAATGKAEALASAGWVGEMNGPRWMRAVVCVRGARK